MNNFSLLDFLFTIFDPHNGDLFGLIATNRMC